MAHIAGLENFGYGKDHTKYGKTSQAKTNMQFSTLFQVFSIGIHGLVNTAFLDRLDSGYRKYFKAQHGYGKEKSLSVQVFSEQVKSTDALSLPFPECIKKGLNHISHGVNESELKPRTLKSRQADAPTSPQVKGRKSESLKSPFSQTTRRAMINKEERQKMEMSLPRDEEYDEEEDSDDLGKV
jgi:hypothetical protein